jgi:hypothetical protein
MYSSSTPLTYSLFFWQQELLCSLLVLLTPDLDGMVCLGGWLTIGKDVGNIWALGCWDELGIVTNLIVASVGYFLFDNYLPICVVYVLVVTVRFKCLWCIKHTWGGYLILFFDGSVVLFCPLFAYPSIVHLCSVVLLSNNIFLWWLMAVSATDQKVCMAVCAIVVYLPLIWFL